MGSESTNTEIAVAPAVGRGEMVNLLLDEASAGKHGHKHVTRREEITDILAHQAQGALSTREKQEVGTWLQSHYDRLSAAGGNFVGLNTNSLVDSYSTAKWNDGSKFLWADMRMIKKVAAHFDELAVGGRSADLIEQPDVEAVIKGATVKRTDSDVTSTFPDGSLTRETADGKLMRKDADGSLHFKAGGMELELAANGSGFLRMPPLARGLEPVNIKLTRRDDGAWIGKDANGDELELAVDDHSVRMRSADMDLLFTSNGGFIRDPSDPTSTPIIINRDGSVSMTENGKSADIKEGPDGVILAEVSDGSRELKYPFSASLVADGKGGLYLQAAWPIPSVESDADGTVKLSVTDADGDNRKSVTGKAGADGTTSVSFDDKTRALRNKDGTLDLFIPFPADMLGADAAGAELHMKIELDGTIKFAAPDGSGMEFKPPVIRKPK